MDILPVRPIWKRGFDRLIAMFFTGLLFLLPFLLTLMIIDWLVRLVAGLFGPETLIGSLLSNSGTYIFGDTLFGSLMLIGFVIGIVASIGYVVKDRARRSLERRLDIIIGSIPVIGGVYKPISKLVRMIGMRDESELAAMRVVACRFGDNGADILSLLASPHPVIVGGEERMLVYLPSAPLPMTGGLVLVPRTSVITVEGVAVEDLLKLYVSLGTFTPKNMRAPKPLDTKRK